MTMIRVAVDVTVFTGSHDNADFDGWVNGFHLVVVTEKATGVTPTVIGSIEKVSIPISFPRPVVFIAHYPIFETELIRHIGMADPVGGFAWRAGAVIDSNECLDSDIGGDVNEVGE